MPDHTINKWGDEIPLADLYVDIEIINDSDGDTKRVLVNGIDMTNWIAADGFAIRPQGVGRGTKVDITLVAKHVTFRTE